ncbi:MAG: ATP-binding cassette domain-containing protein, partial [Gemmatimonadetes bacterium]|nr:ATP-binding cassette domain-containing protein [Gemmatimonadota bacterium]
MRWYASIRNRVGPLDLDVEMETTSLVAALVGPNGSGKTTILRTLAGARNPAEGRIVIGDRVLFDSSTSVRVEPEDRQVGYVPQGYGLFPHLTALDNVAFGLKRAGKSSRDRRPRA